MQAAGSSPPFIFDSDMSGPRLDQDPDFEFFDTNRAANSEGIFLPDDFPTDGSQYLNFGTPIPANHKSPLPESASLLDTRLHADPSAPSTASPGGSSQDSSSESSGYKRTSSFESSRSVVTPGDLEMADDADMGDWKVDTMMGETDGFGGYHDTIDPSAMDATFGSSDKVMDSMFDFASASSSPSTFGTGVGEMDSPEMQPIKTDSPSKDAPKSKKMKYRNSQNSITKSMNDLTTSGSREVSPLSAMVASHESSPSALFHNSPSPPVANVDFSTGPLFNGQFAQQNTWPPPFENHGLPMPNMQQMPQIPPALNGYMAHPIHRMAPNQMYPNLANIKPTLTIHPIPLKSRVETQIPIKMSLFPFPPGVVKLHLPTHTISKPKLLAKPTPERSPNMLELHTSLVCSSAMQNPENRKRAFERAANPGAVSEVSSPSGGTDDEPTSKALNGGDVEICPGCITRERKRAARKKIKKVEEEESWHQYEAKRVIVFNTQEVKEWQQPTPQPPTEATGDRPEPHIPYGALQVDAPMRIACYCRHQNEKVGFQVIFTIKDFQDRVIAQAMTSSIMITDDHKTHNLPAPSSQQNSDGSDTPLYNGGGRFPVAETTFPVTSAPAVSVPPFRLSHSSSDLQSMQKNYNLQFQSSVPVTPSQTPSATMTPRNMSRQTSPSASAGPAAKKRKASGSGKVPTGLAMTRLETAAQPEASGPLSAPHSTAASPFAASINAFPPPPEQQPFGQPSTTIPNIPQQYNTGPPTPNSNNDQLFFTNANRSQSMENLALQQIYSAPSSAHPSRVPSPNSFRNAPGFQQQQAQASAQLAQSIANGFYGIPPAINPHMPPTIHKLIPNEGPKAGGIEVTCLGSGFCQGLEVMFGESKATTTTYWGETSLVCLLPPSAFSGTVAVTFKHQQNQVMPFPAIPKHQAFFKYVDDDEQQLIRTALSVLGAKMTGKMEDVGELARRIVGDGSSWGSSTAQSPPTGHPTHNGFNAATFGFDVESTVLKCLDLIDLDDSPHMPRFNLRRASGQTMLHLACSLGLNRVVAALLARGANPEPRDKSGFTPMHFAALHNHAQIVRRLMLSGADPTVRSLLGYTPADMATSEEVIRAARRVEHHSRTRSGTNLRSRTSSATSLRSLWEPPSTSSRVGEDSDDSESSEDADHGEYQDEDADTANDGAFWMKSRKSSAVQPPTEDPVDESDPDLELPTIDSARNVLAPTAAYAAFQTAFQTAYQKHVQTHFQNIQQHMHLNLPNLPQMPRLDMMMNLPVYQGPMARRISNLVGNNRADGTREQDYRWWDLFSPPAYEEIYPQDDVDTKKASASQAAADAVADNKCAELFDQVEVEAEASSSASSSKTEQKKPVVLDTVTIGQKHTITREQQEQLRLAHAEKVKRLSRDRNLFFIWIPLLLIIVLAMLCNRVPQAWSGVARLMESMRIRQNGDQPRLVEVE